MTREAFPWIFPPGPVAKGLKIGLLGGSFNPAHEGHLYISNIAIKRLGLDYVWWLVSPQNPLKPVSGMAPLEQRLAYAADKYENDRRIFVMDIERTLGTRYTIDTLTKLQHRFPEVDFVWLMGSDNLQSFRRWKRWQDIMRRVPVAVVLRPGSTLAPLHAKAALTFAARRCDSGQRKLFAPPCLTIIDGPRSLASSTQIRSHPGWGEMMVHALPA